MSKKTQLVGDFAYAMGFNDGKDNFLSELELDTLRGVLGELLEMGRYGEQVSSVLETIYKKVSEN